MSRHRHTDYEGAVLQFDCRRCGARRGEWCWNLRWRRTPARALHSDRQRQARAVADALYRDYIDHLNGRLDRQQEGITTLVREVAGKEAIAQEVRSDIIGALREIRGW